MFCNVKLNFGRFHEYEMPKELASVFCQSTLVVSWGCHTPNFGVSTTAAPYCIEYGRLAFVLSITPGCPVSSYGLKNDVYMLSV